MDMDPQVSPYYPPRARWYSSLWRWWYTLKRWLYLDRLPNIGQQDVSQTLLGLVLPGWALFWSKRPIFGVILGTAYLLSAPVFLIWRGYTVSNIALTLMITIHAGSILRIEQSSTLWKRCLSSLMVFLALGGLVYAPLVNQMERHWFVALRIGDHVINVRTGAGPEKIHRGDWIAYRIGEFEDWRIHGEAVVVRSGCALGRVLAVADDEVAFHADSVLINGESRPHLTYMPTNGTIYMEQRCWFIWPEMAVTGHGDVGQETITRAMMQLAMVPETSYIGMPYQRWFWRRQTLP